MRITYLHQYFNTPQMAGSTRSYEMAKRLVEFGHEVTIITSWRDENNLNTWFESTESGIRVIWLPVPYSNKMGYRKRVNAFIKFSFQSALKAASIKSDLVFASSTPLTIAFPAVYAARANKVPMVFEVRDLWPEMPIAMGVLNNCLFQKAAKYLERWAYRNASAIVALSPGMKAGVVSSGYEPDNIAVIPNGCDNQFFYHENKSARHFLEKRPWLQNRPLLVYAGTLGKVNDVGYAVELAISLKNFGSNVCILLVGDGSERQKIVDRARDCGVLNFNLFIESNISKSEVPSLLSAATMGANLVIDLPEARANSANKFFDTLASGKPVFINHGGWMHDLVKSHCCGLAVWQHSFESVAMQLDAAMNDSAWLMSAGQSARLLATDYFDRDKLAIQLEKVLIAAKQDQASLAARIAPGVYN